MQRTTRAKRATHYRKSDVAVTSRRQPRPAPRRQGTRAGIVLAATREG